MVSLKKQISDTIINNASFSRVIEFEGFDHLSLSMSYANIIWKSYLLDDQGNEIDSPDLIQGRIIYSVINNDNRVTSNGITITPEYVKSITPKNEGESDVDYQNRLDVMYRTMFDAGFPEFDFYWNALTTNTLPAVVLQSIDLIDSLKGYDKKRK